MVMSNRPRKGALPWKSIIQSFLPSNAGIIDFTRTWGYSKNYWQLGVKRGDFMIIRSAKDLALYLNDRRKQLKMSQSEVADLVGLKQDTISKFENSPDNSRVDTLFRILSALNLNISLVEKGQKTHEEIEW
ncbi:helix-turn-helix domain-containing protein [Legionella dresdenensis]|uniref:Helix-turn-helix domain-containing protein n=1 Tax=Legionella dresdenensis TaxID=450200 RepID=A0ABV8CE95_9GAMM